MTIYIESEVPAVCKNTRCPNYNSWERVDIGEVREDENRQDYVKCWYCHERIYLDK